MSKNGEWIIKLPTPTRQAMKRLCDEKQVYMNADCIYDDVRVLDRWIGNVLKEGVILNAKWKEKK